MSEPGVPFSIESWFEDFVKDLGDSHLGEATTWPPTPKRLILETLSDTSNELMLTAIAAAHLRRWAWSKSEYGPPNAGKRWFWVRQEWGKTDLSYGAAKTAFELDARGTWDTAWKDLQTGDLGQIEIKVCYTHGPFGGPIAELKDQLWRRRENDVANPDRREQSYYGLVWLMHHEASRRASLSAWSNEIEVAAKQGILVGENQRVRLSAYRLDETAFRPVAEKENLAYLWPSLGGSEYRCSASLALFQMNIDVASR